MMIFYRFRWASIFIVGVSVLVLGYFYVLQPKLIVLQNLQEQKRNLTQILEKKQQSLKPYQPHQFSRAIPLSQEKQLSHLFLQLQQSDLLLQSFLSKTLKLDAFPDGLQVQIIARGTFQQIAAFIQLASQDDYPMLIMDFSITEEKKQLLFTANLLLFKTDVLTQPISSRFSIKTPFCQNNMTDAPDEELILQMTSVFLMKVVGMLAQGERKQAWLLLPDQSLVTVEEGTLIGKEHGIVMRVMAKGIIIRLSNNQIINLTLE